MSIFAFFYKVVAVFHVITMMSAKVILLIYLIDPYQLHLLTTLHSVTMPT